MTTTEYVLRTSADGSVWAHRVKKNGTVSAAGGRVSAEEAERMVRDGEARHEAVPVKAAAKDDLKSFADSVRRTGMAQGRDEDLCAAVRLGYLSESDAMNLDD